MCKLIALLPLLLATPVQAEDWTASGTLGLTSNYVSRGFTQSWGRPALQGGADLSHAGGSFVGVWASTLSNREFVDGRHEIDLYAGHGLSIGEHSLSAGLYHYVYPGGRSPSLAGAAYDYTELKLGWARGIVSATAYLTVSKAWFGTVADGRGTLYLELNLSPSWEGGWTAQLHAGLGRVAHTPQADWRDLKLALGRAFDDGWSLQLAWTRVWDRDNYWTSADYHRDPQGLVPVRDLGKAQLSLTLLKTF